MVEQLGRELQVRSADTWYTEFCGTAAFCPMQTRTLPVLASKKSSSGSWEFRLHNATTECSGDPNARAVMIWDDRQRGP